MTDDVRKTKCILQNVLKTIPFAIYWSAFTNIALREFKIHQEMANQFRSVEGLAWDSNCSLHRISYIHAYIRYI